MRRHGWELPYHPLQVVAIAVFLALAFAFYVFFVPFVGKKVFQYIILGLFSFLVTSVFSLYIWCAGTDPADPAVLGSKKYRSKSGFGRALSLKDSLPGPGSVNGTSMDSMGEKTHSDGSYVTVLPTKESTNQAKKESGMRIIFSPCQIVCFLFPLSRIAKIFCASKETSEQHACEDEMLYCSLCEVEIFKYSKHCRVCDKCVDNFDHHCRWLNNCIGRKNYKEFFALMLSALLLLILQWSTGIFVIVRCFLNRHHFAQEIISKLGSSFSLGPFLVVLGLCTVLAMVATLPLGQLFFFHSLLIKKGVSTYDYIVAMREQEQQNMGGEAQSPQMSRASSVSVLSHSSSMSAIHHGSWCTPPRLFVEDQFSVLPRDSTMPSIKVNSGNTTKMTPSECTLQKNKGSVKISPWALARLNPEEVSRIAAQARKNSKVLRPISRQGGVTVVDTDSSLENSSRDLSTEIKSLSDNRRRNYKHGRSQSLVKKFPFTRSLKLTKDSLDDDKSKHDNDQHVMDISQPIMESSIGLAPLQLEARSAFRSSLAMSNGRLIPSSAESSLASPDVQLLRESISTGAAVRGGPNLQRSTSDGYEASGGESADDSDRASSRFHLVLNPSYTANSRTIGLKAQGSVEKVQGIHHPIEEIDSSPSQLNSPERDLDVLCKNDSRIDNSSRKGLTTNAGVVPVHGSQDLKERLPPQRSQR